MAAYHDHEQQQLLEQQQQYAMQQQQEYYAYQQSQQPVAGMPVFLPDGSVVDASAYYQQQQAEQHQLAYAQQQQYEDQYQQQQMYGAADGQHQTVFLPSQHGNEAGEDEEEDEPGTSNVRVPAHRMTPLRDNWMDLYSPLVEQLGLEVRMNTRTRAVELRECESTVESTALTKATKFVEAYMLGFSVGDAVAILRLDDLYVESFNVEDVKQVLQGDHLSRAIGRVAGKDGKTKFAIENATRTRIVLADRRIHILGSYQNIKIARRAVCDLILGSPPGKVYAHLRSVSSRAKESF